MPRFSFAYAYSLFSFPLLAACGSGADASGDWKGTIRDSAGVGRRMDLYQASAYRRCGR
jgi:hypothetical protein